MNDVDQHLMTVFAEALEYSAPGERAAYLDRACRGGADARARVEALLRAHEQAGDFLQGPADDGSLPEAPGTVIGSCKLLEVIGEGGFGVVYRAEQLHPVRREVALKVLKPGMDSRQVVARFEAERQALALMDHPNIARVFDGGTTGGNPKSEARNPNSEPDDQQALDVSDFGFRASDFRPAVRPYFVMELVRGVPITDFCDQHRLSVRERLELFADVGRAVQHAHQKGVIHRDIKPSNVLVAEHDGVPHAKVIDFGVAKAVGPPLTDKTVVTGAAQLIGTPLYMSPEQAEPTGRDVDARSDIYALGVLLYELLTGTTPFDQDRLRAAGYDEVRRILREEEPARPSTRLSTLGPRAATVSANRQCDPKRLCQLVHGELDWVVMKCLEKDRARRYDTADGLVRDVERSLRDEPVHACPPSAWYRARKFARRHRTGVALAAVTLVFLILLAGGAGAVAWDQSLRHARTVAAIQAALDEAHQAQREGKWLQGQAAAERAAVLLASGGGTDDLRQRVRELQADLRMVARLEEARILRSGVRQGAFDSAAGDRGYAAAFRDYGIDVEALDLGEAARRIAARSIRVELASALDGWAETRRLVPRSGPRSWRDLLTVARRADPDLARTTLRDAVLRGNAAALVAQAEAEETRSLPPATLVLMAECLGKMGRQPEATALLKRAREQHAGDFWINHALARSLVMQRAPRWAEAVPYYMVAVALRPDSPGARLNLGVALSESGRQDDAIASYRQIIERHPEYAEAHCNLGMALWDRGQHAEAIGCLRQALALKPELPQAHFGLGVAMAGQDRPDEAITAFRRAVEFRPGFVEAHFQLGLALMSRGRLTEALAAYRRAVALRPTYAEAHCNVGVMLDRLGRLEEAITAYRRAAEVKPDLVLAHFNLGRALQRLGRPDEAVAAFRRVLDLTPDDADAHYDLGIALQAPDALAESVAAFRRAIELKPDFAEAHCNLAAALRQQGQFALALASMTRGHELGSRRPDWPYPSARWVEEHRRLDELAGRLPAMLRGEVEPADAIECGALALLCHDQKRYAAAARFRAGALTADPARAEDVLANMRFDAASAAARAACKPGVDGDQMDDAERGRLRQRALEWLRADLTAYAALAERGRSEDRGLIAARLRGWQGAPDLAGLRDPTARARLPAGEREAWQQLWSDVQALLQRASVP